MRDAAVCAGISVGEVGRGDSAVLTMVAKDPEIVAEEIAQMIGGRIDFHDRRGRTQGECSAQVVIRLAPW